MAGIEKVCEWEKEGHWHGPDTFMPWDHQGNSIYRDTLQLCEDHKKCFIAGAAGKKHLIEIQKRPIDEGWWPKTQYDFWVTVEGLPCRFTKDDRWHRWFFNKRRWKRKMKKLLGVTKLNIVVLKRMENDQ